MKIFNCVATTKIFIFKLLHDLIFSHLTAQRVKYRLIRNSPIPFKRQQVDSIFYDSKGRISEIITYDKEFETICDNLSLYKRQVFNYDRENLIRDTLYEYSSCDAIEELRKYRVTKYSDYTTIRNPQLKNPFRELRISSLKKYLNQEESFQEYDKNNEPLGYGYTTITYNPEKVNSFGYPSNYIYECF